MSPPCPWSQRDLSDTLVLKALALRLRAAAGPPGHDRRPPTSPSSAPCAAPRAALSASLAEDEPLPRPATSIETRGTRRVVVVDSTPIGANVRVLLGVLDRLIKQGGERRCH
ncbi:hypothetical protein [Actinomyces wuliandei]|uniref:hypothetical protein n=1 Tax=Actinomyces wuliandei TaxID=2057743 RepID=UPI001C5879DE|nr:hypothetical protein [Actinomyces wuliandei]